MEPIELSERLGRWASGRGPLPVLLAARLRRLIDEGELPSGAPLPPDRALASALLVGRSTVVAAYELLRQDGRVVRRQGSGTRVAGTTPAGAAPAGATTAGAAPLGTASASAAPVTAEPGGARHTTGAPIFLHLLEPSDGVIPLACAAPDTPPPELAGAYAAIVPALATASGDIGYHPAGHPALRRAIAGRYTARGIRTGPERIIVTTGAQQALSLLARALAAPGDEVLVEGPTYPGALEVFREHAAVLRSAPVGLAGLARAARQHRIAMAYAIPTFHNPTGAVLPALARRALARDAQAANVPLIDDEVLSDLAFPGTQVPPPLASYHDGVISVGSLSKSVWGGLRIGWVRAPVPLIARLARLLAVHGLGGNVPAQLAAAELLPGLDGLAARQAARLKARHDHLRARLARHLPGWAAPAVPGGQTLWVCLPHGDATSFAQAALRHGVAVLAGPGLDAAGQSQDRLRLPFLAEPDQLTEAVARLAEAWRAYQPPSAPASAPPALSI